VLPTEPKSVPEAYFDFYNRRRLQQSLDYRTPDEVYFGLRDRELAAAARLKLPNL
jgi:hypothetical protein